MIMTCKRYSAAELAAVGLVNQVVPPADLDGAVAELAALLLAKPFNALAEVKARVNTISTTAVPNVNAMTEAFLARE
jgi:enoyl-CoA hydratase/carnithine racemase